MIIFEMDILYYEKEDGTIPVVEYIESLDNEKLKAKVLWEIDLLEKYGFDLKKPYVDSIKGKYYNKLYELRIMFSSNISRIFYFCTINKAFVLLSGYTKKSNKTDKKELDRAIEFMKDYITRFGGKNE